MKNGSGDEEILKLTQSEGTEQYLLFTRGLESSIMQTVVITALCPQV